MRKFVDPFGLSTLDLLSNALGATILLMLIVSLKSRGTEDKPIEGASESGSGVFASLQNMGKQREVKDSPECIIQIKIFEHKDLIKIPNNLGWEIFRTDSIDDNDYWLIKAHAGASSIEINPDNKNNGSIKVQSTVFRGGAPIWHDTRKLKKGEPIIPELNAATGIIKR